MPGLNEQTLLNEILQLVDPGTPGHGFPASRSAAITAWSNAYDTYAGAALDASDDNLSFGGPSGFASALSSAWSSTWTAAAAASAFSSAFEAYWTGATFAIGTLISGTGGECENQGSGTRIFAVELTSIVSVVDGSTLYSELLNEFEDLDDQGADKAARIVACFHRATSADVLVLISGLDTTPPPTGPLPVTNLCHLF